MTNLSTKSKKNKPPFSSQTNPQSKKKPITTTPRNPLTNLNISTTTSTSSSASSVSVEAPRGCLSFFLPTNSSSKTLQKTTPKSAPNPKISNPRSKFSTQKGKKTTNPCIKKSQNGKGSSFKEKLPSQDGKGSSLKAEELVGTRLGEELGSGSGLEEAKQWSFSRSGESSELGLISFDRACLDINEQKSSLINGSGFGKEDKSSITIIKPIPCLNQWKNGKDSSFMPPALFPQAKSSLDLDETEFNGVAVESLEKKQWSFSRKSEPNELKVFNFGKTSLDGNDNVTPLNKLVGGSEFDSVNTNTNTTTKTTTPPIEASISPEVHHRSSLNSTTPACFAAGHVLSGVTDKRKCRPRGLLTVGEELGFCEDGVTTADDKNGRFIGLLNSTRASLVPSPTGASVDWLLSPCKEEDDRKDSPQTGLLEFESFMPPTPFQSLSSPSSGNGFSSEIHAEGTSASNTSSTGRRDCWVSPTTPVSLSCEPVMPKAGREDLHELATESTQFSGDSLGSQNVISTPKSDSSVDRLARLSWLKNGEDQQECQFELDSLTVDLSRMSLSPKSNTSVWDPADVLPLPGFSFQFTRPTSASNFTGKSCLQKNTFNDQPLRVSNPSYQSFCPSEMRISWREGLVSRIYEMDELDCCRCLSDEEEDISFASNYQFEVDISCQLQKDVENDPTITHNITSPELMSEKLETYLKSKENLPPDRSNSCAESISTEGGLIASGDSDWTQCYKNQLFKI